MPTEKKFDPHRGFHGIDGTDGDVEFLKVDTSPWDKVSADDTYQARRFNDDDGHIHHYVTDFAAGRSPDNRRRRRVVTSDMRSGAFRFYGITRRL